MTDVFSTNFGHNIKLSKRNGYLDLKKYSVIVKHGNYNYLYSDLVII